MWDEYLAVEHSKDKAEKYENVHEVWNNLRKAKKEELRGDKPISWSKFLRACKEVAEYHSARTATLIPPFDFTTSDGESFSCLLLELWASESYDCRMRYKGKADAFGFAHALSRKTWKKQNINENMSLFRALVGDQRYTLSELLRRRKHEKRPEDRVTGYTLELYKAWF